MCATAISIDFIEELMEVSIDEFYAYGTSFHNCLHNLDEVVQQCKDTNLVVRINVISWLRKV
jgi:hypothetical protein